MKRATQQKLPDLVITDKGHITFPNLSIDFCPSELRPEVCRTTLYSYKSGKEEFLIQDTVGNIIMQFLKRKRYRLVFASMGNSSSFLASV